MSAEPLLQAKSVDAFYGTSQVLFGLDLTVMAGQVMALIGRNGAGKTTTMRSIMGILPPRRGEIRLAGRSLVGVPPYQIARAGVGYVPEDRQVFPFQTVEENLEIAAKPGAPGTPPWTMERVYRLFPILHQRRRSAAGHLSGGEQQMLAMARTLMGNPTVLLLDEPSEGLAPIIVNQIAEVVLEFRRQGLTVLLAEQNMHFCLRVATDLTVISKGKVVHASDIEEFRRNDDVKLRYLTA